MSIKKGDKVIDRIRINFNCIPDFGYGYVFESYTGFSNMRVSINELFARYVKEL